MKSNRSSNHNGFGRMIFPVLVIVLTAIAALAQVDGVDPTFNASPVSDSAAAIESGMAVPEPDGKMIILVRYTNSIGGTTSAVNRVNSDGSIDDSFNCTSCSWPIYSIGRQSNGKVLVAGSDGSDARVWRLNADGGRDTTFQSPYDHLPSFSSSAQIYAVTPDGKIYASRHYGGFHTNTKILQRLNTDGSIDSTFTASTYDTWNTNFRLTSVEVLPGGKLLIVGKHGSYGQIFRLNNDGTKDNTFDAPALSGPTVPGFPFPNMEPGIKGGTQQADGKVVFAGSFDGVNAIPRLSVARLSADSSVDGTTVGLPISSVGGDLRAQTDGKIIILAGYTGEGNGFRRVNADLTIDPSFNFIPFSLPEFWVLDNFNRIVIYTGGSFIRFNNDGTPDMTFNFSLRRPGTVASLAVQNDGKIIVAGNFGFMGNASRKGLARVNPDGSNDPSFDPGTGFDVAPDALLLQADGKILASGTFTSYNGSPAGFVARINANGSLDSSFTPTISGAAAIALQADGKVLLGGGTMTVNGLSRTGVARLNPDGTTDTSFNPFIGSPNITSVIPQADGKIAFAGGFSGVNGFSRTGFARLNSDGSLDSSLNAGNIGFSVKALRQPDGKYLLAGSIIIRRNADGSADSSFVSPSFGGGSINSMLLDPAGRVLVGGYFDTPRLRIARLGINGAIDANFVPAGADGPVRSIAVQADGKVLAGGDFTGVGGVLRPGVVRFTTIPQVRPTRFDFDGDGRADVSITQPGDFTWKQILSFGTVLRTQQFGLPGDNVTPADYDGDGKTDIGVFDGPSGWWYKSSQTGQTFCVPFGQPGDIPIPGDFDGDGKADFVVVRNYTWYGINLNNQLVLSTNFGQAGDKPITGDFDGDGKTDVAVYRPSTGEFIYGASANGGLHTVLRWGSPEDVPVPADYDGDGKTDAAVFRPSTGYWWVLFSRNLKYRGIPWGLGTDKPVPADYDGDGMADISVFRPSDGNWYFLKTAEGYTSVNLGTANDIPTENAFIPPSTNLFESIPGETPGKVKINADKSGTVRKK